jgi:signal peptidase II
MLQGHVWPLAVFGIAALVLIVWKRKSVFGEGRLAAFAEPLMYAGITGNVIDRLFRGYVIDMFDFHWGVHHFPVFNLADSFITVAAAILIAHGFFAKRDGFKRRDDARDDES